MQAERRFVKEFIAEDRVRIPGQAMGWEGDRKAQHRRNPVVIVGRQFADRSKGGAFQSSLRDLSCGPRRPGVETPGYWQLSLRDVGLWGPIRLALSDHPVLDTRRPCRRHHATAALDTARRLSCCLINPRTRSCSGRTIPAQRPKAFLEFWLLLDNPLDVHPSQTANVLTR